MSVTVEQARRLSEAAGVDVIAALSALERHNGDALEAMLELERMGLTPVPPGGGFYSTRSSPGCPPPPPGAVPSKDADGTQRGGVRILSWSDLKEGLKELFQKCLITRLEVWQKGRHGASVPLPILVVLVLFFPWTIVVVLGVGLLLGFRYRLSGPMAEGDEVRGGLSSLRETFDRFLTWLRRS